MTRCLRRDQRDVDAGRRGDRAVVNVEAVREQQRLAAARRELRRDAVAPDRGLRGVGRVLHQDVAPRGDLVDRADGEARILRGRDPARRRRKADANLDAGVAQVECVGVALRAVADDGDFLGLDQTEISVAVVEDAGHWEVPCGSGTSLTSRNEELEIGVGAPRVIATAPVRAVSRPRSGARTPTRSSLLSCVAVSSMVTSSAVRSMTRAPNTSQTWRMRGRVVASARTLICASSRAIDG